jgi:DNA-directed RNA polymerase specialized sigma24 family protein
MHIFAGLTFAQIAQTLGEPLQTVASRYRRALQALKEALESEHERTE